MFICLHTPAGCYCLHTQPDDAHPRRQATLGCRHPLLLVVNLLCTLIVALIIGCLFYQSGFHYTLPKGSEPSRELPIDFNTGVLMRIGMIFFLGLYFTLTSLVSLSLWSQAASTDPQPDTVVFSHAALSSGAVALLPRVCLRLLRPPLLRARPHSIRRRPDACGESPTPHEWLPSTFHPSHASWQLPTVLCAAILYPMVGLSSVGESAPTHSLLFTAGLCLCNLVSFRAYNEWRWT